MRRPTSLALALAMALAPMRGLAADKLSSVEGSHSTTSSPASDSSSYESAATKSHDSKPSVGSLIAGALLRALLSGPSTSTSESTESSAKEPVYTSLGIEPYDPSSSSIYAERSRIVRHAELAFGGFLGADGPVFAHDLHLRGYLGFFTGHAEWARLYEPSSRALPSLDLLRFQLGGNVLAGQVDRAELHVLVGALILHGAEWTPAFDSRLETRIYPIKPLVITASVDAAFFEKGAPLWQSDLMAGASVSRFDLRGGVRWIYQSSTLSLPGPAIDMAVKW